MRGFVPSTVTDPNVMSHLPIIAAKFPNQTSVVTNDEILSSVYPFVKDQGGTVEADKKLLLSCCSSLHVKKRHVPNFDREWNIFLKYL